MEGEREETRDQNEGSGQQQPIGQQDQSQQISGQSDQSGSEPPRSPEERGEELGQQSERGEDGQQSQGGFVASQDQDSGEYLQQSGSPETGFAEQGRGASNDSSDIEGTSERTQNRESDIEGSSDNS